MFVSNMLPATCTPAISNISGGYWIHIWVMGVNPQLCIIFVSICQYYIACNLRTCYLKHFRRVLDTHLGYGGKPLTVYRACQQCVACNLHTCYLKYFRRVLDTHLDMGVNPQLCIVFVSNALPATCAPAISNISGGCWIWG